MCCSTYIYVPFTPLESGGVERAGPEGRRERECVYLKQEATVPHPCT